MRFTVSRSISAPPERVWDVLVDWERQADWMLDAIAVRVLTPQRTGVGVTIECPTRLLGVTVDDVMRVTAWDPPRRLAVVHLGRVITGSGVFDLRPEGSRGTVVDWTEEVDPPLGALGEWGADRVVRPGLERLFARSLDRLAVVAEKAD